MTPRKALFIAVKNQLESIAPLELIDLDRGQMQDEKHPHLFVAALIKINNIQWECMTEQNQEGSTNIEVSLYCRDGWLEQHQDTEDVGEGYNEIDLLDNISEKLQFLTSPLFMPLQLVADETKTESMDGIFAYTLRFSTLLYRKHAEKFTTTSLSLTPNTTP